MPPTQVEQTLIDINAILGQFIPMVGTVGVAARGVIALLRAAGQPTASFEEELAKYDAQKDALAAALADFKAKYPIAPVT